MHLPTTFSRDCRISTGLLSAFTLTWALAAGAAKPATETLTVREQLNQTYARELVTYPFAAKDGACVADSVQLAGPNGPVAAQLTDIEFWPGKKAQYVKAARVAFIVDDLKPLATVPYALSYGKSAAKPPATDLQVKQEKDSVEIATAQVGVRLLLGNGKPAAPVAAKDVPGPLLAIRLGSGAWAGGSAVTGETEVAAWMSELTDSGPVLARLRATYTFADGNVVTLTATVAAGDNTVRWEMNSREDRPALGFTLRLPPVPGVQKASLPKGYGQWARNDRTADVKPGPEPFVYLSPDSSVVNIFAENPPNIKLVAADGKGPELQLRSRDAGAWSEVVAPLTYAGYKKWVLDDIALMWEAWKRKRLPVSYAADGTVTLAANFAKGSRTWWSSAGTALVGDQLDSLKDMVLDWPADPKRPQPRVFVGLPEIRDVWTRAAADPELKKAISSGGTYATQAIALLMTPPAERQQAHVDLVVKALRDQLALLGNYDVMRGAIVNATLYDVLIDSDLITPADKALFRAQMAYLGYLLASPRAWSMEHGYLSGNPNMSCSYTLSHGIIACALVGHPAAKAWADRATQWMDKWLTDEVGPNGEWIPEGSHYGHVSLEPLITYAIAAKRAGYHDFSTDPRLKKVILYFAKYNTPRDVQRNGLRTIGAYGRGHGGALSAHGVAAPFFKDSDPELSRTLQWMWSENGYPVYMGDGRLGGTEPYYLDRRLPAAAPAWTSELFPNLGVLLRAAFNTPTESYVNLLATTDSFRNLDIWTPGIGGISQWFARGKPLSTCFTFAVGYNERHELLRDGVRLARNWGEPADPKNPFGNYTKTAFATFAALPQADYVRATYTNLRVDDRVDANNWFPEKVPAYPKVTPAKEQKLEWTRQLLFVKDADPAGPAYLVLRDTTGGGQPTAWQFWTLSEKLGGTAQARDAQAFLADKPGQVSLPARELPAGDRYTALGQFDMDVEYFVASPAATPRHTLRYGGMWAGNRVPEWQDLLHLQQPGDGVYYIVVYPRPRNEAVPTFTKLANDAILKTVGGFGTDYAFLATAAATAAADGVTFTGTAGTVQQRPAVTTLALAAAGEVGCKELRLAGPVAAALKVAADALELSLPADSAGGEFTVTAPGTWKLKDAAKGVKLDTKAIPGALVLTVPQGVTRVVLGK